ncbi:methenyltetrahydromethanopterin cyclohydrolase [Rubrivivax gelatinosus]|uniref:Methenyltetrahydromethanopterin cyclohydrolase n=1 Tax=Rubrivivax gelatinosus (strain NBRC 100245 / IL144) TaxID=983917 RepID=I0HWH4_RUBGI|nr:methenyltetrahydromethanopterin cyclohydrolase [Rubrivivax gelatinosus]BAL97361.1 methenyltetrahydromethanopterin cyclohydrolase Mch [Rubrivivax gelatinosus IL144]
MNDRSAAPLPGATIALNEHVAPWVERLCDEAAALGVEVSRDERGVRLVDAGIAAPGSVAAGLLVGEICLGGLGRVELAPGPDWPTWVQVRSSLPVLACLGSQYAGWSLAASKEETGGKKFFALGSGPARALAAKEALYGELDWRDHGTRGVLVMEVDRPPPAVVVDKILRDCALAPEALTIVLTPTRSAAGTTQVVARVLEVALHKAHELHFALADVVDGVGWAPLPAPHPDGVEAMGRTNDAILYGGRVHLSVRGSDAEAERLARALPCRNSPDYGRSFAQTFRDAGFDFYKIDPALFAPAEVWVSNVATGRTWHAGGTDLALLQRLWQEAS